MGGALFGEVSAWLPTSLTGLCCLAMRRIAGSSHSLLSDSILGFSPLSRSSGFYKIRGGGSSCLAQAID